VRYITDPHERIFLASLLIFVWMMMVVFSDTYTRYQIQKDQSVLVQNIADTSYQIIKLPQPRCGDFLCRGADDFDSLGKRFEAHQLKQGVLHLQDQHLIADNKAVDTYIRSIANELGYLSHSYAYETALVYENELLTQSQLRSAYHRLRDAMKEDGIDLHVVSGYRSFSYQQGIFLKRLGMSSINEQDLSSEGFREKLLEVLTRTAPPGYSKHHTGFAVDFACDDEYLVYDFQESACYTWMSENNFERIKTHGFIPSYPEGLSEQGPEPEPWEYLWVGTELL